ncbi:hypothetical protein WK59_12570 [Burkholderia ubonensis]|nr:hypothetical protein WK59_12570 [Burkholderia ubonensis]
MQSKLHQYNASEYWSIMLSNRSQQSLGSKFACQRGTQPLDLTDLLCAAATANILSAAQAITTQHQPRVITVGLGYRPVMQKVRASFVFRAD